MTVFNLLASCCAYSELVGAHQRLKDRVGLLHEQPTTGPEGTDHGGQSLGPLGHVDEDEAGMDKVEQAVRGGLGPDVVAADLVGGVLDLEPRGVDVGGQHVTAALRGNPGGHTRTAGPDLPHPPARREAQRLHDVGTSKD